MQDPSRGEQEAPLWQEQDMRQPRPQEPGGQLCLHCGPAGRMSKGGHSEATAGSPLCPVSPVPVQPGRQWHSPVAGSQPSAWAHTQRSPQPAPNVPFCSTGHRLALSAGWWHQNAVPAAPAQPGGLTGQGCRHWGPCQPGGQWHTPLWGSQGAPWAQSQLRLQLGPQAPAGHGFEQSGPCHPAG